MALIGKRAAGRWVEPRARGS